MGCVLITGGSRGMGRATALKFAEEGHDVGITYRNNAKAADEVLKKIEAAGQKGMALKMDLADPKSIDAAFGAFFSRFEKLDYLFNNAAIFMGSSTVTDQTWEHWETMLKANVIGQWYCTRKAVLHMAEKGGGAIVYNASISGVRAFPFAADYAATKHAVLGMMKGHALECAAQNIRVNAICPGFVRTDMFDEHYGDEDEAFLTGTKIPARRLGKEEEMASLVYWLLVEGTYCYGESIVADGGMVIGPILVTE